MYRQQYQPLVRFLHRKVWDAERAQDIAQEAFARALGKSPDNPKAWLFRVASNLARDEARTDIRRREQAPLLQNEAAARASGNDTAAAYDRQEQWDTIRRALDQLNERDREVLLRWDAGMSYQEIAETTGLAPGAVGTTLNRARKRLVEAHAALESDHVPRG